MEGGSSLSVPGAWARGNPLCAGLGVGGFRQGFQGKLATIDHQLLKDSAGEVGGKVGKGCLPEGSGEVVLFGGGVVARALRHEAAEVSRGALSPGSGSGWGGNREPWKVREQKGRGSSCIIEDPAQTTGVHSEPPSRPLLSLLPSSSGSRQESLAQGGFLEEGRARFQR